MNSSFARLLASVAAAAVGAAACTDSLPLDGSALTQGAVRYEVVAGDQQSAPAGAELPQPLVVRVLDAAGQPIAGQIVNWVVTAGGGSVFAGRALTNQDGVAQEWWTLGPQPGANSLEARAVDSTTGEARVFGRFQAMGTDTTQVADEPQAAPAPPAISLSAMGYKHKGKHRVDLGWAGATTSTVDIYRDDQLLVNTANDGGHLDAIDRKGSATYRYRLCEAGSTTCSAEVVVTF